MNADGTTMLLTTHYMEEADRLCSRLAIIDDGRIVVDGSPESLKAGIGADTVVLQLARRGGGEPAEAVHAGGADTAPGSTMGGGTVGGDGQTVANVCRLLDGMLACDAVAPHPAGVSLAVPDASATIPAVLRRLDGDGLEITGLHMSRPSLDDVFMQYTGRRIREEAADQPIVMGW